MIVPFEPSVFVYFSTFLSIPAATAAKSPAESTEGTGRQLGLWTFQKCSRMYDVPRHDCKKHWACVENIHVCLMSKDAVSLSRGTRVEFDKAKDNSELSVISIPP